MSEIRARVEIADVSAFTSLELTRAETLDVVEQNPNTWVFVGNQMVQPAELNDIQWGADTIRLVPPLSPGCSFQEYYEVASAIVSAVSDPEELAKAKTIASSADIFDNFDMDESTAEELLNQLLITEKLLRAFRDIPPGQACREAFERLGFVFDEEEKSITWHQDKMTRADDE